MVFYIGLAFIPLIFGSVMLAKKGGKDYSLHYTVIMIVVFGAVAALRAPTVGVDTMVYSDLYLDIANANLDIFQIIPYSFSKANPFYYFLMAMLSRVFESSQAMIFISSSFSIAIIGWFIYKYSLNITASWFYFITFYFYLDLLNLAKQYFAISLLLTGYYLLNEKKYIKFIAVVILAILTHPTSFIFLPIYVLKIIKLRKRVTTTIIWLLLFSVLLQPAINLLIAFFPQYRAYMDPSYVYYIFKTVTDNQYLVTIMYYMALIFGFYMGTKKKKITVEQEESMSLLSSIIIFSAVLNTFFWGHDLFDRSFIVFDLFIILYIPNMFEIFYDKKQKWLLYLVSFLALLILLVWRLYVNRSGVVPYQLFFSF